MLIMIGNEAPPSADGEGTEHQPPALLGEIPTQRTGRSVLDELSMLALTSGNPEAAAAFLRPLQERSENAQ